MGVACGAGGGARRETWKSPGTTRATLVAVKTPAARRPACEASTARPGTSTSRQMARWQKSTARDAWQRVQGCSSIPRAGRGMWQGAVTLERWQRRHVQRLGHNASRPGKRQSKMPSKQQLHGAERAQSPVHHGAVQAGLGRRRRLVVHPPRRP